MLTDLRIRDFAIVDRIAVAFESGMTVLTGETGAGKSILVDALGLVLGERGSAQMVRSGAKRAEFSAEFDITAMPQVAEWLDEQSLDADGDCLLRRVINADGRSRAFINGNAVPVQQLKVLGEFLVDIHGQHFHQSLGRRNVQRNLLDFFGGLQKDREQTAVAYEQWHELAQRFRKLTGDEADRAARIDLLTFQYDELSALAISADEIAELRVERQKLANSGRLADGVAQALQALSDDDERNASHLVADAARAVGTLTEFDAALSPVSELLESAGIQIGEAADELRRYAADIDMDPGRQNEVEERLDAVRSLARKHRVEPAELPELTQRLAAELEELTNAGERSRELEQQLDAARESFLALASNLSARRKAAAKKLAAAVSDAMHGLGMPGGTFEIELRRRDEDEARSHGLDDITFMISANPGQPLMPLSRVASGGELSRMSLAIQVIASDGSSIPTMVFDEVDSGVGGGVAEMVGRRLAELGETRQVLCVTHLPQVASLAAQHFRIAKVTDGKATRTQVDPLDDSERIDELARMLGGVKITRKTREHAAEMLSTKTKNKLAM